MSTFAQMRAVIADDLNRSDMTTQINRAINRAIHYYTKERFWFNEKTSTFSTTNTVKNYDSSTIPTDIAQIDYMEIVVSGSDLELTPITYTEIESMDVNHQTGIPSKYAWYKENIYLFPIPNNTYTVNISYQQTYADLSADSDTNDWTTSAEDLIEARACWWIYARVLKDQDQANSYKALEIDALESLREQTTKLIDVGGTIVGTNF